MVRTRAGAKMGVEGNAVERELEQSGPSLSLADSAAAVQTPSRPVTGSQTPSRPVSTTSSRSSVTMVARKLAAEASHARRIADLEREAAKLELRAELAAIDADASHRSSKSSRSVNDWLQKSQTALKTDPAVITNIFPVDAPHPTLDVPVSHMKPVGLATSATNANINLCSSDTDRLVNSLGILIDNVNKGACHRRDRDFSLPFFDGKSHLEWLSFKRAFLDAMDSYSAVENIDRLNRALKGCAREAVVMLLATAREPIVVLRALDMRFGRPELIVAQEAAAMRALPRVSGEGKDLAIFATRVRNCVEAIRLLNQTHYLTSPELIQSVISKISPLLRAQWVDYAGRHEASGLPMLEMFADFLANIVELQSKFGFLSESAVALSATPAANSRAREKVHAVVDGEKSRSAKSTKNSSSTAAAGKISCALCQQGHTLTHCDKFVSLSIDDKWKFIKKKRICHRCLKEGWHRLSLCSAKSLCDIDGCIFRHHSLLHNPNSEHAAAAHVGLEEDDESAPSTSSSAPCAPSSASFEKEILSHASTSFSVDSPVRAVNLRPLLKVVAVTVSGPSGSVDTYALLDDGSTATFIDAEVAAKIGVKGPEGHVHVDCIGGLNKNAMVRYVDFHIKGRHMKDSHLIRRARSIDGLGVSPQFVDRDAVTKYPYLADLAEELCYGEVQPMLIIGIDNWHLTVSRATRKGSKSQPVAIRTALGWVLFGFSCSSTTQVVVSHATLFESTTIGQSDRSELEQLIKEQYKLESIGISKRETRNVDDERAVQIVERTAYRLPSGRFEVGLIWKSDDLSVPNSYNLALSRFLGLEKKLGKDIGYAERYRANVHDMVRKGYAELCPEVPSGPILWYLPHFGVVNPNKPNKLRIVHDAAAKYEGVSLNSLLLPGPDLLQPLLGILFRFREGKIGLTADIREMFPQIKIRAEDRDAQRFLWRDSPRESLRVYRMSSMMFGAASSPFTAMYIKNKNAAEHQVRYPDAAHAITFDHYMDDCIVSLDSVDEAAKLAAEIHAVHRNGGFEMRGWTSNSASALRLLPKEALLETPATSQSSVDVDLGHLATSVRTLGLIWQPAIDCLGFNIGLKKGVLPDKLTKRVVLAHVMRVFDPLGILAPIVVTGRIMFQNAWRKGLDWDEELSRDDSAAWRLWFKDLVSVANLQIPRCYYPVGHEVDRCELHVFSDASESAFAAVAYWRFVLKDGQVKLALICSKVRVAPLKPVSIPRLELQGALIAARLASAICDSHRFLVVRQVFWCDSMTVLNWLRSETRKFKPFVAHRVGEILEITSASDWRWVPSELNVADDATRMKRTTLSLESRWVAGPEFLLSSEWPNEPCSPSEYPGEYEESRNPEPTIVHLISSVERPVPVSADPKRFSSWLRLVRATCKAHKYLTRIRLHSLSRRGLDVDNLVREQGGIFTFSFQPSSSFGSPHLTHESADDIRLAETHILRQAQLDSFPDEVMRLCSRPSLPIPRTSRLFRLSMIVDEEGLLRLSSRIAAVSGVSEATKSPIVLDGKHPAVQLLVDHHHRRAAHANTETVVNELRQEIYLLGLRNVVRSVAFRCQQCRIRRAEKFQPPTGNLPEACLAHHKRPFTFTGLDYFGPVQVTIGRRQEKRWVALYTCLVVRAIHLDVVGSLSTDSAVMSLRRFVASRGTPSEIWSDNGTAFVGARRELRALYGDAVMDYAATQKITPFMGGVWERLVRSVKTALRVTLTERAPTEEVLRTVLTEAEALINSRPLTHVSVEPGSEEALTPNHFLLGASSGRPIPATLTDQDLVSRSGWRKAVRLADHFWQRWVKEYLPNLVPRPGQGEVPELAVGDLVLIADGNLPRGSWPRGRISATYPGRDGIIRVADVKTAAGTLRRPLKKLVKLRA